jgi:C-terminal processing protease CtpA/Prc
VALLTAPAIATDGAPAFQEVFEVLRTNLTGTTETELNAAAVNGLLTNLRGRAALVDSAISTNAGLARFTVIDRIIGVAQVRELSLQLAGKLTENFQAAAATNKLKGLVLDLRFAASDDYAAVVSVAELFVTKDRALLDWGNGLVKSSSETAAIDVPVAVLVNRETLGAPEALAGVLQETGQALVLGNPTAGRAFAGREFELASGHKLRVASTPVKLGDGAEIPATGLKPDITVMVALDAERQFVAEPYGLGLSGSVSTNTLPARPARSRRPSEAELVRERREITNQVDIPLTRDTPSQKPVIIDPVLARAVDLLKGLAVVRGNRS